MGPKRQDRHKKVECDVCNKLMRSDHLKRHKQTHRDLLSLPVNEIKNELETRQEIKKKQEERIQKIEEIAKGHDLAIPEDIFNKKRESANEIDDVRARCLQNYQFYLEKIKTGKHRKWGNSLRISWKK